MLLCLRANGFVSMFHVSLTYIRVQATGTLPAHSIYEHFPELASWFVVLSFFTWSGVSLFNPLTKPPNQ